MVEVTISKCFKVERENAKAMVEGFNKAGKRHHLSIYCSTNKSLFYDKRLLLTNKGPLRKEYPLSEIGEQLDAWDYEPEYKYVVSCIDVFEIKNVMTLWNRLCSNDVFDIWKPEAPFNRFDLPHITQSLRYYIKLIRLYELDEPVSIDRVKLKKDDGSWIRHPRILRPFPKINIKNPIISNDEIQEIKNRLITAINQSNAEY